MESRPEGFSVREAAKITGASETAINFWSGPECRVFTASIVPGGQGRRKRFDVADLVRLRIIHLLAQGGTPLETIRNIFSKPRLSLWFDVEEMGTAQLLVLEDSAKWNFIDNGLHRETGYPTRAMQGLWEKISSSSDVHVVNLIDAKEYIRKRL